MKKHILAIIALTFSICALGQEADVISNEPDPTIPELANGVYTKPVEKPEDAQKCNYKKPTADQVLNGVYLRDKVANTVTTIVESEKQQGRNPKVFIIGRVGQDFSGVMTLKDNYKGKKISVQDIFSIINPSYGYGNMEGNGTNVNAVQSDIRKEFGDPTRQLSYSHVGFLIIDHPIAKTGLVLNTLTNETRPWAGEKLLTRKNSKGEDEDVELLFKGQYWVEELLKPCVSLAPKAWVSGLTMFFQDDPYDYKAVVMLPSQDIQNRIYNMLVNKPKETTQKFLGKKYNAAAGAFNANEQNSNQYVLEILAAAQAGIMDTMTYRSDVFPTLQQKGYTPTKVIANSFKAGFMATGFAGEAFNMRNGDHPFAVPYVVGEFVTELSIREYVLRNKIVPQKNIIEINLPMEERQKPIQQNGNGFSPNNGG